MNKTTLSFAIAGLSLLIGCGKSEQARSAERRQYPKSPQEYEQQVIKKLRERNTREGTSFDVKAEAERMRQRYNGMNDSEKIREYERWQ